MSSDPSLPVADDSWMSLPYHQRITHKQWRARVSGYEEILNVLLKKRGAAVNEVVSRYASTCQSFPLESNEAVKEKALSVLLILVDSHSSSIKRNVHEIVSGLVSKCLASSKTKTRDLSFEIVAKCIEIEQHELTLDALYVGMESKQPKVVATCIECVRRNLQEFGIKVVNAKKLISKMIKVLDHRDAGVRKEAKLCIVELCRWMRSGEPSAVLASLQQSSLKGVIISELESDLSEIRNEERRIPVKYLRSQKPVEENSDEREERSDGGGDVENAVQSEDIDPLDLLVPIDLLSRLPNEFYTNIQSVKWQERREALDSVKKLIPDNKFVLNDEADYSTLIRSLLKVITHDTNILLVLSAAQQLEQISLALRTGKLGKALLFQCIEGCIERSREKKANVVDALRKAAIALMSTDFGLFEVVLVDVLSALADHKVPSVKQSVHLLIKQTLANAKVKVNKKLAKMVADVLNKNVGVADKDARDSAFQAIGQLIARFSPMDVAALIPGVDSVKMAKIEEYAAEYRTDVKTTKAVPKKNVEIPKQSAPKPAPAPLTHTKPAKQIVKKSSVQQQSSPSILPKEEVMELETAETITEILVGSDCFRQLSDSEWKVRLEAAQTFSKKILDEGEALNVQAVMLTICKSKPGMKESIFQVLRVRIELIKCLAERYSLSKPSLDACANDLIDKLADLKNAQYARDALLSLCESSSPAIIISDYVVKQLSSAKSPKLIQGIVDLVKFILDSFSSAAFLNDMAGILKALGALVKICVSHTNAQVRASGCSLCSKVAQHFGDGPIRSVVSSMNLSSATMSLLENELKMSHEPPPPQPTRTVRNQKKANEKRKVDRNELEVDEGELEDKKDDELLVVLNITQHDLVDNNLTISVSIRQLQSKISTRNPTSDLSFLNTSNLWPFINSYILNFFSLKEKMFNSTLKYNQLPIRF